MHQSTGRITIALAEHRQSAIVFLTVSELCERWRIDRRTLDKIDLPWFCPRPRVRLIDLAFVQHYEQTNGWQRSS